MKEFDSMAHWERLLRKNPKEPKKLSSLSVLVEGFVRAMTLSAASVELRLTLRSAVATFMKFHSDLAPHPFVTGIHFWERTYTVRVSYRA